MSIVLVFGTIWLVTVIEVFVCHFTLWWLLAVISRVLFTLRLMGAVFRLKKLAILEAVAAGSMIIWNMMFAKGHVPWFRILMFIIFGLVCVVIMLIDDITEVYVSVDEEEE